MDLIDLALTSNIFFWLPQEVAYYFWEAFTLNWLAHHLDSAKVSAQPVSQDLLAVLSQVASYDSDSRLEFE